MDDVAQRADRTGQGTRWAGMMSRISTVVVFVAIVSFTAPMAGEEKPRRLGVLLMLVGEKQACRPSGYTNYPSSSNCERWTAEDIDALKALSDGSVEAEVPPSTVKLGIELTELLELYRKRPKDDPSERLAVVVVLDFRKLKTGTVTVKRDQLSQGPPRFPKLESAQDLRNERRYIYHERADAFHPSYRVRWTLTAGSDKWILEMDSGG